MPNQADAFRSLEEVFQPDPRQAYFVAVDRETGEKRARTIADHHAYVADLQLDPSVPKEIAVQFDTARNVYLYSWFAMRLVQVAERQGYAVMELALRVRLGREDDERPPTLAPLLQQAVSKSLIYPEGFRHFHRLCQHNPAQKPELEKSFVGNMTQCIRTFRNALAHGSPMMYPEGWLTLELCCDLINQLYPAPASPVAQS